MDDNHAPELYHEYLPPELILDPDHPATDPYLQSIELIKRSIISHSSLMHNSHVEIVKQVHLGRRTTAIAESMGLTPTTISRAKGSDDGKRLLSLLRHLSMALEGPMELQRKHYLWRVAKRNEITDPRVGIAAIAEINRMTHQEKTIENTAKGGSSGVVQIMINNNLLPRGDLDS